MEQVMHLYIGRCSHETGHAFFTLGDAPMKQVMLLYIKRCFSATGDTSLHQEMLLYSPRFIVMLHKLQKYGITAA